MGCSECWTLKQAQLKKLYLIEIRMLRGKVGVTTLDKESNKYIGAILRVRDIGQKIAE